MGGVTDGSSFSWQRLIATAIISLILFAGPAASADRLVQLARSEGYREFKIPSNSPVQRFEVLHHSVRFPGRFKLGGSYSLTAEVPDGDDTREFQLVFIPDRDDAAQLPSVVREGYVDGVQDIVIVNFEQFIQGVVGPRLSQAVWNGRTKVVSGHIKMWVDQYEVSGQCDSPVYYVRFVELVDREPTKFASAGESSGCG